MSKILLQLYFGQICTLSPWEMFENWEEPLKSLFQVWKHIISFSFRDQVEVLGKLQTGGFLNKSLRVSNSPYTWSGHKNRLRRNNISNKWPFDIKAIIYSTTRSIAASDITEKQTSRERPTKSVPLVTRSFVFWKLLTFRKKQ